MFLITITKERKILVSRLLDKSQILCYPLSAVIKKVKYFMAMTQKGKDKWYIEVTINYDSNGKRNQINEMFYGKKSDARIRESEIKNKIKKGVILNNNDLTLNEFINKYRKEYMINLAPKTIESNEILIVRIKEKLGHLKLKDIKTLHLVEFYNYLRAIRAPKPLSENTVLHYYVLINRMLEIAIKWDLLEINPNRKTDRPKIIRKELKVYSKETTLKLVDSLEKECLKYKVIIYLAIDTGARRGELTGLEWEDIDFKNNRVHINKVTQSLKGQIIKKPYPKNNTSIRTITVSKETMKLLEEYKEEQNNEKTLLGSKWEDSNKVFINETGGLMHPDTPSKIFYKITKKYGLPHLKFHGLRHLSASLLITKGIHMKVISKRLGHASCLTTDMIYSHIDTTLDKEVANVFNDLFNERKKAIN